MAEAVSEEEDRILIQCTCKYKKKDCTATLTSSKLCLEIGEKQTGKEYVRLTDILSVRTNTLSDDQKLDQLCIENAKQEKNLDLFKCSLVLDNGDLSELKQLGDKIEELLGKLEQRPRKLLVFINPISGRSRGVQVYEQTVAPIFKETNIETDVIITERPHHTEEILSVYDLLSFSGIVVVGGDGLFHEVVNGLMQRRMKELDRNVDDPNADMPDIEMPLGIIPCGTGNGIAYSCFGSYDVVTAALEIVLGFTAKSNILPVHSNGKLVAYSILNTGYGLWGDFMYATESKRSLGIWRYPIVVANQIFIKTHRQMNLTIHWKEAPADNSENSDRMVVNENAVGLMIPIAGAFSKESLFSTKPPSNTFLTTILNKPMGRMKFLSFMIDLFRLNMEKITERDDVFVMEGCEWTVKLDKPSDPETEFGSLERMINIDGEIFKLQVPEFQTRLCSEKITLYSNLPYSTGREVNKY